MRRTGRFCFCLHALFSRTPGDEFLPFAQLRLPSDCYIPRTRFLRASLRVTLYQQTRLYIAVELDLQRFALVRCRIGGFRYAQRRLLDQKVTFLRSFARPQFNHGTRLGLQPILRNLLDLQRAPCLFLCNQP